MPKKSLPFQLFPLDPNFVGPKPIESVADSVIHELEAHDNLIIERKRNGHCALVPVIGSQKPRVVELYSRSVKNWTAKFPRLVEELRSMNIPRDTLLAGEALVTVKGVDSPSTFSRISGSSPTRAIEQEKLHGPAQLRFFNVIVYKGKSVIELPYADRFDILRELTARCCGNVGLVEVVDLPFKRAKARSLAHQWEGLVLYDKRAGSRYRLDGRSDLPLRPDGCWKWKNYLEGDFVAMSWNPSTSATYKGLVRDFNIYQRNPETGEFESWGVVAARPSERHLTGSSPIVLEIRYERITENNRLIGAHILRVRDDKTPAECFSSAKK